jgi:serine/threonine protein kinase
MSMHGFVGLERAGAGAMASVFRGTCARSGRAVALKRVLPALAQSEHARQLFDDECRVHATLEHPRVVSYVAHGRDEQGPYLAMEWVEGTNARTFVSPGRRLTQRAAIVLGLDVLEALGALHRGRALRAGAGPSVIRGAILHRDVSPANVLVGADGIARLADFGLARALACARSSPRGTTAGKLGYLPPEVLSGRVHATRGDLYALGVVLWEVLAGERLFAHVSTASERARAYVLEPRRPIATVRPGVTPALAAVIDAALSLDPPQRPESAERMASALSAALAPGELSRGREDLAEAARGVTVRRARRREATRRA